MPVSWYILNPVKVVSGCYHPILKEDCYRRVFTEEGIGGVGMLDLSRRYPNSPRPHLRRMHHAVTMMLTMDDVGTDDEIFCMLHNCIFSSQSEFNSIQPPCLFLSKLSKMAKSTSERRRKCCIPGGGGRKRTVCPRIGSKSIHSGRLSDRDYEDCCRSSTPSDRCC